MRHLLLIACISAGCAGEAPEDMNPDPGGGSCPMPATTADAGALVASKTQMCNVPNTQGMAHWYRIAATLPGTMNYVQVELWDKTGAFGTGTVHTGQFTIAGADADLATCGVCVRGLGDKGGANQKEYIATGGSVNVMAVGGNGAPMTVALSNISFVEVDATAHKPVASGCASTVAGAKLDGTVVQMGGGGGSGGGGGGGGGGMCPQTVGD